MNFDPFEDRKSRDVRNSLAHGIIEAIQAKSMEPFENLETSIIKSLSQKFVPEHIQNYIQKRKERLYTILSKLGSVESLLDNHSMVSIFLWNQGLFFEFHEWMEEEWLTQTGDKRKVLQSLILAAVVYEHLEYNRPVQAQKVAQKTIKLFQQQKANLPQWINTQVFIEKLENLDHVPPLLEITKTH